MAGVQSFSSEYNVSGVLRYYRYKMRYVCATMLRQLFLIIFLAGSGYSIAQDAYFTQFYASPLELNPALTGAIEGSYRVSLAYRDQWNGMLDNPYRTFGMNADVRFEIGQKQSDYIGGGISFIADKVATFDFNTTGIKLSGAFHKNLDSRTQQYLSGGLYFGLLQKNVNVEQLSFNDQFNGLDGFTFGTLEQFPENNFGFLDIGLGLNYAVSPSDDLQFTLGGSIAHMNKPSATFGSRTEGNESPDVELYSRFTAYVSSVIGLSDDIDLLPRFAFYSQGKYVQMNFGTNVRFALNRYNSNAAQFGAGLRLARDLESISPSAAYLFAGIELGNFLLGINYDYNINDLVNERLGQGVLEFSVTFIGEYSNENTFCPSF